MFITVANNLVALCALIVVGFVLARNGMLDEKSSKTISDILLKVALPAVIIVSMQRPFSVDLITEGIMVILVTGLIQVVGMAVALGLCLLAKPAKRQWGVWMFAVSFSNVSYMGIPVISSIYGNDSIFYISMATVTFNVLAPTLGTYVLRRFAPTDDNIIKEEILPKPKKFRPNPIILATLAGFLLFVFSIKLPSMLAPAFNMAGSLTTPLSMMIIGAMLARTNIKSVFGDFRLYLVVIAKLFIMPLCMFLVLSPFLEKGLLFGTLVYAVAMPTAAITAVFAEQCNSEPVTASKIIFLSTTASLISIPVISLFL